MKTKSEAKTNYAVLSICKEYSDEHHLLNEEKIQDYLKKEYGIYVGTDVIQTSLTHLVNAGVNIEIHDDSLFYTRDVFNYENTKKHCIFIQELSVEQSVKEGIIDKLLNDLSRYQRKKLKKELQYDISNDQ